MGIYVRRGLEKDFDPQKMKPGEWAVSIDSDRRKQKIWMCFAPGIVKRMGTYEDFEDQIQDATEEIKQQYLTAFNEILTQIESDKNTATEEYAYVVQFKELLDSTYRIEIEDNVHAAATSASNAQEANVQAQTYMDNAQTYMNNAEAYAKEAKTAASSITGALKPKGTVTFANLPALSTVESGAMYNISTAFISNSDFKDGGNITYPAGTNVYKTEDGMWDCLAGQLGDYLMKDDIDTAVEESMPDYTASAQLTELVSGEKLSTALGKLKTAVKNVIALIKLLGSTDISKIGDGSVTGAISAQATSISELNSNFVNLGHAEIIGTTSSAGQTFSYNIDKYKGYLLEMLTGDAVLGNTHIPRNVLSFGGDYYLTLTAADGAYYYVHAVFSSNSVKLSTTSSGFPCRLIGLY